MVVCEHLASFSSIMEELKSILSDDVKACLLSVYLEEPWAVHCSEEEVLERICRRLATPPLFSVVRTAGGSHTARAAVNDWLAREAASTGIGDNLRAVAHPVLPDVLVIPSRAPSVPFADAYPTREEVPRTDAYPRKDLINGAETNTRKEADSPTDGTVLSDGNSRPKPSSGVCDVIVDARCGAAVLRGAPVYVPGIVGAPGHMLAGARVRVFADVEQHPSRRCRRGATSAYEGARVYVGAGEARVSRREVFSAGAAAITGGVGVDVTCPLMVAPRLEADGELANRLRLFPQNLPSVVCGHVLAPAPDDRVLDMCAAPGGKTTHLAQLMGDAGCVVALDKSDRKVRSIADNARILGLQSVRARVFDATKACDDSISCADFPVENGPPYPAEYFDRVLVDAPCSALGQRPQLTNLSGGSHLGSFPPLQRRLLDVAVRLLRPGGALVYSTCTLTTEENEAQVTRVLSRHPEFVLESVDLAGLPGLSSLGRPGIAGVHGLTDTQRALVRRFDPILEEGLDSVNSDTIGFFLARFRKKSAVIR